jgi:hypothetical protein
MEDRLNRSPELPTRVSRIKTKARANQYKGNMRQIRLLRKKNQ